MKLFKTFFRNRQKQSVDTFECYEVRWVSRYGEYAMDIEPEVRLFPLLEHANEFADALREAFKLIKHTSGTEVSVTKQTKRT